MKLLLIDGHYYVYRSFFAIPNLSNSRGEPTNAILGFTKTVRRMLKDLQPEMGAVFWDEGLPQEEVQRVLDQMMDWIGKLAAQGIVKGGQPLGGEGRIVSLKQGREVADGPFAESKEAVGGYILLKVPDMEAAVAIAKANPALKYGLTIEVRPALDDCPILKGLKEQHLAATN